MYLLTAIFTYQWWNQVRSCFVNWWKGSWMCCRTCKYIGKSNSPPNKSEHNGSHGRRNSDDMELDWFSLLFFYLKFCYLYYSKWRWKKRIRLKSHSVFLTFETIIFIFVKRFENDYSWGVDFSKFAFLLSLLVICLLVEVRNQFRCP